MNRVERGALWCIALAVFLIVNPTGLDGRAWQEIVLVYGGVCGAVIALAGATPLSAACLWIVSSAAVTKLPGALNAVILLLCWLGLYALAKRHGARRLIVGIALANVVAMALQVVGLWEPVLRLASSSATVTVYNELHPWAGLTSSTGDLACVLAMALPFAVSVHPAAVVAVLVALLSTSSLSGIVAGLVGLAVALYPAVERWARGQAVAKVALAVIALMVLGIVTGEGELRAAWQDDRWQAWERAAVQTWDGPTLAGHGLGGWARSVALEEKAAHAEYLAAKAQGITVMRNSFDAWTDLHFDLLQAAFDLGLIGVLLIAGAWAWLGATAYRARNLAAMGALAAVAVCQFGHFPFHLAAPSVVAALVAGEAGRG